MCSKDLCLKKSKIIQLVELGVPTRRRLQAPQHRSPLRVQLCSQPWQEGTPSGRVLSIYSSGNLPRAPQYLINSSQLECLLLYFIDMKTRFFFFFHISTSLKSGIYLTKDVLRKHYCSLINSIFFSF